MYFDITFDYFVVILTFCENQDLIEFFKYILNEIENF